MRQYQLLEFKQHSVVLQDLDTLVIFEVPKELLDQYKHLLV